MSSAEAIGTDHTGRIADDIAIRNVVARLALLADMAGQDELDDYGALFTEDASWEMAGNQHSGRMDIMEAARGRRRSGSQGPGTNSRHLITTQAIRFEDRDVAISDAYFVVVADTATAPTIRLVGHYHDLFRREAGTWKVARRQVTPG
jgi:3-phenylpropionate/cinnamic acid dioxygenase small subunit